MTFEERQAALAATVAGQHKAIGNLVVEFEAMVAETRYCCMALTYGPQTQSLAIFHQPIFTASPLWETLKALVGALGDEAPMGDEKLAQTKALIKQLTPEYFDLVKRRNQVVHSHWILGSSQDWDQMESMKMKPSITGNGWADAPQNVHEIEEISERCRIVARSLLLLRAFMVSPDMLKFDNLFNITDGKWLPRSVQG